MATDTKLQTKEHTTHRGCAESHHRGLENAVMKGVAFEFTFEESVGSLMGRKEENRDFHQMDEHMHKGTMI